MVWAHGHQELVLADITLACGATAEFDYPSESGHRCTTCGAMVGSVGMPRRCAELEEEAEIARKAWKILKEKR